MSINGLFIICILGFFFFFFFFSFPLSSTCWIPNSDSGDLEKSKRGCGFLKVCQKPWGLSMIGISIEVEMSLNA